MKEIAEKLFYAVSCGKITTEEYKITVEVIKKVYNLRNEIKTFFRN